MHINRRKNDTQRIGHHRALGRSQDPELDVVAQLCRWMLAGLAVQPRCAKRARPAAACELCPPLFPLTHCAKGGITAATRRPCSRQQASDWIRWAVKQAGGDSSRFSGVSARKGGISTAIEARVDETILYLQSGHGAALPARAYMQIASPASRDVRGLRPLTGRGTSKLGVSCSSLFWVASRGWVGLRPLGLGWDGEMVVRR